MQLKTTAVVKCLDRRLSLMGFEVPDLLAIFLTLSILNFLFGQTSLKIILVWLPTLVLACVLHFGKKGKPENYLVHWIRFQLKPGTFSAFTEPTMNIPPPRLKPRENV